MLVSRRAAVRILAGAALGSLIAQPAQAAATGMRNQRGPVRAPRAAPKGYRDLYALSPNRDGVWRYKGVPGGWEKIGGPASSLVGGSAGLIATNPDTEEVWRYAGSPFNWNLIGGPGAEFVVNNASIYGLSPDRSGVRRWGGGGRWYYIGGPAEHIYGGFETLLATNRRDGNVWSYNDIREEWTKIGDPGREFAAGQYAVYGLSPDRSGVWRHGVGGWQPLGGGYTEHIYAGRSTLLALDPAGVRMWAGNQSWDVIGGPGQQYVINDVGVFGRDGNGVWRWTPGGTHWSKIGEPAATIVAA